MKALTIILFLLVMILLSLLWIQSKELLDVNRTQQSELNGLKEANKLEKDSLLKILELKDDSLSIAKNTIELNHAETLKAHEQSQKEIKKLQSILFVRYESDSARLSAIRELYKSYTP